MSKKVGLTLKQKVKNVYFCPYCKIVSVNSDDFKPKKKYNQYEYTCFARSCGKSFTQDTYRVQSKNGKHYYTGVDGENVKDLIEEIVIGFYKQGFSYRKVSDLTHFSRTRIEGIIKSRIRYKSCKKKVFFEDVLKMDTKYIINNTGDAIVKMLKFGFTQRQVIKLLKIYHLELKNYISGHSIENVNKHKIKIEGNTITYSYFN